MNDRFDETLLRIRNETNALTPRRDVADRVLARVRGGDAASEWVLGRMWRPMLVACAIGIGAFAGLARFSETELSAALDEHAVLASGTEVPF